MNPTLAHLRALLERALSHTANPALLRLPEGERTVLGLCLNYIGGEVAVLLLAKRAGERRWANLSEPMRARAVVVALALALGLDPGVGGLGVRWARSGGAWSVNADRWVVFGPAETRSPDDRIETDLPDVALVEAPTVAAEPDPIKALTLAVLHILEAPRG